MKLFALGSGSGGNSTVVESGGTLILVDVGFSVREGERRLRAGGFDPAKVAAVLFTHDHSDHCRGAGVFHRKYPDVPLMANGNTADAISVSCGVPDGWSVFETGEPFEVGSLSVTAFPIPHDAADPVGYLISAEGKNVFIGTDIGFVTENVKDAFSQANAAVLEANHDPILLMQSNRSPALKQRIRGRSGHLSNDETAELIRETNPPKLKTLLLGHISQECNSYPLARKTIADALSAIDRNDVTLDLLEQDSPSEVFTI